MRQRGRCSTYCGSCISIHALTGSATTIAVDARGGGNISIHALTGSATTTHTQTMTMMQRFQSTHSRGVRLTSSSTLFAISDVFQSTHSRGVRHLQLLKTFHFGLFQSTHSRGVRPIVFEDFQRVILISIHALTGSATHCLNLLSHNISYFNPRTHGECDIFLLSALTLAATFQSTHSRGVRPKYRRG